MHACGSGQAPRRGYWPSGSGVKRYPPCRLAAAIAMLQRVARDVMKTVFITTCKAVEEKSPIDVGGFYPGECIYICTPYMSRKRVKNIKRVALPGNLIENKVRLLTSSIALRTLSSKTVLYNRQNASWYSVTYNGQRFALCAMLAFS